MSEITNIGWTDSTWNPWTGCRRVSPGCKNCYMFAMLKRFGRDATERRKAKDWKKPLKWNRDAENASRNHADRYDAETLAYDGAAFFPLPRPRIFPSLCDWLDDEVPIEWLADFLKLIHDTPNLDWLLLTKRPENFEGRLCAVSSISDKATRERPHTDAMETAAWFASKWFGDPPSNVWLGVSVEDRPRKDRLELARQIPAAVRFVSFEPLLEDLELTAADMAGIHWAIIGMESGKNRRDCGIQPLINIVNCCFPIGVKAYVKQDCAFKSGQQGRIPDEVWSLKQFPKC